MIVRADAQVATQRDDVRREIREQARISVPYVVMNLLAAIIASYGLLTDSAAVVIAAMIVALLLGPIIGIALALADNDRRLLATAATTLLLGVAIVYATALIIGAIHHGLPITGEILSRTSPTILDLAIALAGGAAGAYASVSPRVGVGLIGAAVATALVPPLCASAMLVARGEFHLGGQALLLAFANIVAIQFVASIVLLLTGYHEPSPRSVSTRKWLKRNAISLLVLVALLATLSERFRAVIANELYETHVRTTLKHELAKAHPLVHVDHVRFDTDTPGSELVIRATVRTTSNVTAREVADIERMLPDPPGSTTFTLRVRQVRIRVITRSGPLIDMPPDD